MGATAPPRASCRASRTFCDERRWIALERVRVRGLPAFARAAIVYNELHCNCWRERQRRQMKICAASLNEHACLALLARPQRQLRNPLGNTRLVLKPIALGNRPPAIGATA